MSTVFWWKKVLDIGRMIKSDANPQILINTSIYKHIQSLSRGGVEAVKIVDCQLFLQCAKNADSRWAEVDANRCRGYSLPNAIEALPPNLLGADDSGAGAGHGNRSAPDRRSVRKGEMRQGEAPGRLAIRAEVRCRERLRAKG
jgi:hypothetical protein